MCSWRLACLRPALLRGGWRLLGRALLGRGDSLRPGRGGTCGLTLLPRGSRASRLSLFPGRCRASGLTLCPGRCDASVLVVALRWRSGVLVRAPRRRRTGALVGVPRWRRTGVLACLRRRQWPGGAGLLVPRRQRPHDVGLLRGLPLLRGRLCFLGGGFGRGGRCGLVGGRGCGLRLVGPLLAVPPADRVGFPGGIRVPACTGVAHGVTVAKRRVSDGVMPRRTRRC